MKVSEISIEDIIDYLRISDISSKEKQNFRSETGNKKPLQGNRGFLDIFRKNAMLGTNAHGCGILSMKSG